MTAKILDGKKIAAEIRQEIEAEVTKLAAKNIVPGLAIILVGNDPASQSYVRSKKRICDSIGLRFFLYELSEETSEDEVLKLIDKLNREKNIHGILVQLPLPEHLNKNKIINTVSKEKDVDGFRAENFGQMAIDSTEAHFKPCTAQGVIELLKRNGIEMLGKECVVVGRSNIVGKPLALLMLQKGGTVTVCHSKTQGLAEHCRRADILVSAVGKVGLIRADMVKKGAAVVDVGINRTDKGKIVGDVDFEAVKEVAGAISPVPGGVGPLTVIELIKNTVEAAKKNSE